MATLVALLVYSLTFTSRVATSAVVPLAASVLAAIMAAYGAWHVTDRVIAWRGQRPEPEED